MAAYENHSRKRPSPVTDIFSRPEGVRLRELRQFYTRSGDDEINSSSRQFLFDYKVVNSARRNDITQEETTLHKDGSSAVLIALEKEGEKEKQSYYNTGYSYLAAHANTNLDERGLTLLRVTSFTLNAFP